MRDESAVETRNEIEQVRKNESAARCQIELDRRGGIIDYGPRETTCAGCDTCH